MLYTSCIPFKPRIEKQATFILQNKLTQFSNRAEAILYELPPPYVKYTAECVLDC